MKITIIIINYIGTLTSQCFTILKEIIKILLLKKKKKDKEKTLEKIKKKNLTNFGSYMLL